MEVSRTGRDNIRDTLTDFFLSRIRIMSIWVERVDFTGKRIDQNWRICWRTRVFRRRK